MFLQLLLLISQLLLGCRAFNQFPLKPRSNFALLAKKDKSYKAPKGQQGGPSKAETQSKADKFDALTRKYMFTIKGLTKALPDGSRTILKNINLCFYPGELSILIPIYIIVA